LQTSENGCKETTKKIEEKGIKRERQSKCGSCFVTSLSCFPENSF
jgi:hypothetical protein